MLLRGSFVPIFLTCRPTQLVPAFARRSLRCIVACSSSKASSLFWEALPMLCHRWKGVEVHCKDISQTAQQSAFSESSISRLPELSFDRLQVGNDESCKGQKRTFSRYIARGALLDEEYWTASWLRAEAQWESVSYLRHVNSYKKKYAEQEFYALKRRCSGRDGNSLKCFCIVTVKKDDPTVRRTVLNSVVGTLDLSIRQFLQGETLPREMKRNMSILARHDACDSHRYAYIANVCVSKFARRQGIATNMLHLATDMAISLGVKQLFVHVNVDNTPAQELYRKTGFELIEASSNTSNDQRLLMLMEI